MELQQRLDLLADLSMASQGFRPPPARLLELTSLGLLWLHPSKPPVTGMTEEGKATFLSLLCEGSGMDPTGLALAARRLNPSAAEFDAGSSFLDTLEAEARSGTRLLPNAKEATFACWLCQRLPRQPPPLLDVNSADSASGQGANEPNVGYE